jgi:putative MATE family efflux protein
MSVIASSAPAIETRASALNPRTHLLLHGAIVPTLLRLAWPNILVMLAQASTGLIETWWVSHLGTDALAGMALVFPVFMMMQMLSAGAMGGGISSAIARALGAGNRADADALVLHAIIINGLLGLAFSVLVLAFGPSLYGALGGEGDSLQAALLYSTVVFAGTTLVWLMNAFASVIRGTGNMFVPSLAICLGVVLLIPLSPLLIFGFGPFPALGIAGAGLAVVLTTALTGLVLFWYVLSGRSLVRLRLARLRPALFNDILGVGAVGSISTLQTTLTVALTTALVGTAAGPDAIAGYGTGGRLEYLLVPLVFGLGAPLVALVGTNIGAGQQARALRIALIGGALAFAMTEAVGLAAAIWPAAWLGLFGDNPRMLETGAAYLRSVGPAYGFFGLGLALYFASQGAGRLFWPLFAGLLRMLIAVGGGWAVLRMTGSLGWLFAALSLALVVYGLTLVAAVASGAWFRRQSPARHRGDRGGLPATQSPAAPALDAGA